MTMNGKEGFYRRCGRFSQDIHVLKKEMNMLYDVAVILADRGDEKEMPRYTRNLDHLEEQILSLTRQVAKTRAMLDSELADSRLRLQRPYCSKSPKPVLQLLERTQIANSDDTLPLDPSESEIPLETPPESFSFASASTPNE